MVTLYFLLKHYLFILGKNRGIAIPVDLDTQVASMFNKNAMISKHTRAWLSAARTPRRVPSSANVFRNDRSIIEGLQVCNLLNEFFAILFYLSIIWKLLNNHARFFFFFFLWFCCILCTCMFFREEKTFSDWYIKLVKQNYAFFILV